MRRKYHWTPERDGQLRRVYSGGRFNQGVLKRLAQQWRVPDWVPGYRARQLGLARIRESEGVRWRDEELAILERGAHLTSRAISRRLRGGGFRRSENAVQVKRLELRLRERRGYSAHELGQLMGVTAGMICDWIRRGMLEAKPRLDHNGAGNGEHPWLIRPGAVKRLVRDHTSLLRLGRVDKYWFVDLMTNTTADREGGPV